MLVNQLSALLAAIPMAAALSVRGGPGGWHGGHGGPHGGGGGHGPNPDEPFQFRIVTYDLVTALTKQYFEAVGTGPEYGIFQTPDEEDSGIFKVDEDGYLIYTSPEGVTPALGPLIANYDLDDFNLVPAVPVPVEFALDAYITTESLTKWEWVVDYDDYTLYLKNGEATTPYKLLLCEGETEDEHYLAVGVGAEDYLPDFTCVATHLDIEPVDEDYHRW